MELLSLVVDNIIYTTFQTCDSGVSYVILSRVSSIIYDSYYILHAAYCNFTRLFHVVRWRRAEGRWLGADVVCWAINHVGLLFLTAYFKVAN